MSDENLVLIKQYKLSFRRKHGVLITLPTYWANLHQLKQGDILDLYQSPGSSDIIIKIHKENKDE